MEEKMLDKIVPEIAEALQEEYGMGVDASCESELLALGTIWRALGDICDKYGITDGFFPEFAYQKYHDCLLEHYDETRVTELGQLIGETIIMCNPAQFASKNPDQPFSTRKGNPKEVAKNFVFKPLPLPSKWEKIDRSELNLPANACPTHECLRYRFSDDVWFELYEDTGELSGRVIEYEDDPDCDDEFEGYWRVQLCVPNEIATMHGTNVYNWVHIQYLVSETPTDKLEDVPEKRLHVYELRAQDTTQLGAWYTAADFWQGIAYRFL